MSGSIFIAKIVSNKSNFLYPDIIKFHASFCLPIKKHINVQIPFIFSLSVYLEVNFDILTTTGNLFAILSLEISL